MDDEIYDVIGWLLLMMFNVDSDSCGCVVSVDSKVVKVDDILFGKVNNLEVLVVYIVVWGDMVVVCFLILVL